MAIRNYQPALERATFLADASIQKISNYMDASTETEITKIFEKLDEELRKPYTFRFNSNFNESISAVFPDYKGSTQEFTAKNIPDHRARAAVQVGNWCYFLLRYTYKGRTLKSWLTNVDLSNKPQLVIDKAEAFVVNGLRLMSDVRKPIYDNWGAFCKSALFISLFEKLEKFADLFDQGLDILKISVASQQFNELMKQVTSSGIDDVFRICKYDATVESFIARCLYIKLYMFAKRFAYGNVSDTIVTHEYVTSDIADWMYNKANMQEAFIQYLGSKAAMQTLKDLAELLAVSAKDLYSSTGAKQLFDSHTRFAVSSWRVLVGANEYSYDKVVSFFNAMETVAPYVALAKGSCYEDCISEDMQPATLILPLIDEDLHGSTKSFKIDVRDPENTRHALEDIHHEYESLWKLYKEFVDHYFIGKDMEVKSFNGSQPIVSAKDDPDRGVVRALTSKLDYTPPCRSWSYLDENLVPHIYHIQIMEPINESHVIGEVTCDFDNDVIIDVVKKHETIKETLLDSTSEHYGIVKQKVISTEKKSGTVSWSSSLGTSSRYRKLWYLSFLRMEASSDSTGRERTLKIYFDGYSITPPRTGVKKIIIEKANGSNWIASSGVNYSFSYCPNVTLSSVTDLQRLFLFPADGFNKDALEQMWTGRLDKLFFGTFDQHVPHHEEQPGFLHSVAVPVARSMASRMIDTDYSSRVIHTLSELVAPPYVKCHLSDLSKATNIHYLPGDFSLARYVDFVLPIDKRSIDPYFLNNPVDKKNAIIYREKSPKPRGSAKRPYYKFEVIDKAYSTKANKNLIQLKVVVDLAACSFNSQDALRRWVQDEVIIGPKYFADTQGSSAKDTDKKTILISTKSNLSMRDEFAVGSVNPTSLPSAILLFCKDIVTYIAAWYLIDDTDKFKHRKTLFKDTIRADQWISSLNAYAKKINASESVHDYGTVDPLASEVTCTWAELISSVVKLLSNLVDDNYDDTALATDISEAWKLWGGEDFNTIVDLMYVDVVPYPYFLSSPERFFERAYSGLARYTLFNNLVSGTPRIIESILGSSNTFYSLNTSEERERIQRLADTIVNNYVVCAILLTLDAASPAYTKQESNDPVATDNAKIDFSSIIN